MNQAYPVTITAPPALILGNRVLAWAQLTRREGHYPDGIVLCRLRDGAHDNYVTWHVFTRDGGMTWHAYSGHYFQYRGNADADFIARY